MSDEWTVSTLHEHMCKMFSLTKDDIDDRFQAQKEATENALHSAEKAVEKAERLAEIRAETQDRLASERSKAQNEWRASLQDMTSTYVTQGQYEAAHQVLVEKISSLSHRHDTDLAIVREQVGEHRGRSLGQGSLIIWLLLGFASIVSIMAIVLDILLNYTIFALLMWSLPQRGEVTFSMHLNRLARNTDWRGTVARWLAANLLDSYDPSGKHIK